MDLKKLLFILYELTFHFGFTLALLTLMVIYYPKSDACLERMSFFVLLILILRIDKCLTFVSIYLKKSALEFEITIVAGLIFLLNSIAGDCSEDVTVFSIFTDIFFYGVLILNCLAYIYSLLVILFFGLMILVLVLRGGQNNLGLNIDARGLTVDQMADIEEKTYLQLKENEVQQQNNQNNQIGENNQIGQNNNNLHINIDAIPNENEKVCSICLSEFLDNEMVCKLPECNHIFHRDCIREWLARNQKCPFCRNDIKRAIRRKKRALLNRN